MTEVPAFLCLMMLFGETEMQVAHKCNKQQAQTRVHAHTVYPVACGKYV